MADTDTSWKVLRHDPVVQLTENLRWVKGALPGMSLERNMTAVRLADGARDAREGSVQLEYPRGLAEREGAMLVRSADGTTLVLNDSVMNMDSKRDLPGLIFTTLMGSAPGPRVSRLAKLALVKDKRAFRGELERYAAIPDLVRLIVAHEKVAEGPDARAALLQAASYL
jgi:hypothetical protein